MKITRDDIRNVAIIAHVDHGKTTLVDELLKQSGVFRDNQEVAERVMDSNDIERERGITILSKNTAVFYKDTKINIIDTPGHADFGGEVERVLKMVNGVVLVVDAFEGTMPQTKFVLMKALALNLPVIVCINKIDRPEARPAEVIDEVLEQSGTFRANQEVAERVMDSNDIERERGITILSKNTAITYKDTKINIIDTPGHADFGGEVERVLKMVNGVILVVDAFEGVMPQTKFVLQKALDMNLSVIVCINKIDRPEARPEEVIDEILELFIDLDANEDQLDCPFIFASAKSGYAMADLNDEKKDMQPLFDCIVNNIPAPEGDPDADTQMLISTIDYNEFVGRIGVGKIDNGSLKVNQEVMIVNHHDPSVKKRVRITKLYTFNGLNKVEVNEAGIGEIVAVSGIADIHIGDTICSLNNPVAIPFQKISEPTLSMDFMVNDSPLAGKEGKFVTSRHIRDFSRNLIQMLV